jgi:hypothetical protein
MQMNTSLDEKANLLKGRSAFLSASIPQKGSGYVAFEQREIIDAVVAFSRTTLAYGGRLVFGGHPTISPLILHVAAQEWRRLGPQEYLVDVYQSAWFENMIPESTLRLVGLKTLSGERIAMLHLTPKMDTKEESLEEMRRIMLLETNPCCAIFIGGMDGIREEFEMFTRYYGSRPIYCIGGPGGCARQLAISIYEKKERNIKWSYSSVNERDLLRSRHYPLLAADAIMDRVAKLSSDEAFTLFWLMAITKQTREKAVHLQMLSKRLQRESVSVKSDLEELSRMDLVAMIQEPRLRAPASIEVQKWETKIDVNDVREMKGLLENHPEIVDYIGKQRIAQSLGI